MKFATILILISLGIICAVLAHFPAARMSDHYYTRGRRWDFYFANWTYQLIFMLIAAPLFVAAVFVIDIFIYDLD